MQDLAVKIEGTFILHYRVFDIFSRAQGMSRDHPVQAETYGAHFNVYSTKNFPGLSFSSGHTRVRRSSWLAPVSDIEI